MIGAIALHCAMPYSFANERFKKTPMPDAQLEPYDYSVLNPSSSSSNSVAKTNGDYQTLVAYWDVVDAVKGGTSGMREAGKEYLPQDPNESDEAYAKRLSRATLAPWYKRLCLGLVGMVLRKPVQVEASDEISAQLTDVNLQGDDLQAFTQDLFSNVVDYNYAGILVEYPDTSGLDTRADEVMEAPRPYWTLFRARDILLPIKYQQRGSLRVLSQVRLRQMVEEDIDEFSSEPVEQILAYDLIQTEAGQRSRLRIYREIETNDGESEWVLYGEPKILSISDIPFVLCCGDRKSKMIAPPPMVEVAHLNIKHYQMENDLDHALHISNVARWLFFGVTADEIGRVGSIDEAITISNPDARSEWSSPSLSAFQPTQERLKELEMQMAVLGLSTLVAQKNVGESAEAKKIDRAQGDSIMAMIAQNLQDALDSALYFHAAYLNLPEPPTAQVSRDFDASQITPQMLSAIAQIRSAGDLSRETFWQILQQAEIGLPDEWQPEEEQQRIEAEFKAEAMPILPSVEDLTGFGLEQKPVQ